MLFMLLSNSMHTLGVFLQYLSICWMILWGCIANKIQLLDEIYYLFMFSFQLTRKDHFLNLIKFKGTLQVVQGLIHVNIQ